MTTIPSLLPPSPALYTTRGGIEIRRESTLITPEPELRALSDALDTQRGVLLSSGYDYPGRYSRWDIGFVNPPLALEARDRDFRILALNERGRVLLPPITEALRGEASLSQLEVAGDVITGAVRPRRERFVEEERSRQPSLFSVVRVLSRLFYHEQEPHLGLYGAFGYDLTFQFEPIPLKHVRPATQRDLVLYLPDELIVVDRQKERAARHTYDFRVGERSTEGLLRSGAKTEYAAAPACAQVCDHAPGEYAAAVERARESFRQGDLFELVLSQTFRESCDFAPSELFRRLQRDNPAPYALLLNLGDSEYLVGASPEMYVRVEGSTVETCPISGTITRGGNAVEDAEQIRQLLLSGKEESELTMCTDVDRNDKSRICEPGSVEVVGRRQIELYSRLIHTVDHVKGTLRPEFDALDAFLTHTWAVTVTGAPKPAAIARVEAEEKSPRSWYGGAVGAVLFNGNLNTGLTLRTVRIKDGMAEVRAGATLLYDSDPQAEEAETRLKAAAFLDALKADRRAPLKPPPSDAGRGRRILLVDHEDSFVHTLANYLRQGGASVSTVRSGFAESALTDLGADMVVLSPGPGTPSQFQLNRTIELALRHGLPVFGVCLGLQGLVEYFGGSLGVLDYPMHGKPSNILHDNTPLFAGVPSPFQAARYHSLFARPETLPDSLKATARTEDGVIMAIEHENLPIAAVQFHPESILTLNHRAGMRLIDNVLGVLRAR